MLAIRFSAAKGVADGFDILYGEHNPQDRATVAAVLQDLLADRPLVI